MRLLGSTPRKIIAIGICILIGLVSVDVMRSMEAGSQKVSVDQENPAGNWWTRTSRGLPPRNFSTHIYGNESGVSSEAFHANSNVTWGSNDDIIANYTSGSILNLFGNLNITGTGGGNLTTKRATIEELYESTDGLNTYMTRVTNDTNQTIWPRGSWVHNGNIYVIYNKGAEAKVDREIKIAKSTDNGDSWTTETIITNPDEDAWALGVSCFSGGIDSSGTVWIVVRYRNNNTYDIGDAEHRLWKSTDGGESWVEVGQIGIDDGTQIPIQYSSFAELGNGNISFGYHFQSGEVGIAQYNGSVWSRNAIYDTELDDDILVEPTIYYDDANGKALGFLRTQDLSEEHVELWWSTDNCSTYSTLKTDIPYEYTPIPILKSPSNDYYYGLVVERRTSKDFSEVGIVVAPTDTATDSWDEWSAYLLGGVVNVGNDAGQPSGIIQNNKIKWFLQTVDTVDEEDIICLEHQQIERNDFFENPDYSREYREKLPFGGKTFIDAYVETDQSITGGATYYTVNFSSENMDTKNEFDTTNYQFTPTETGWYEFQLAVRFHSHNDGDKLLVRIRDTTTGTSLRENMVNAGGSNPNTVFISTIVKLTGGNVIEIQARDGDNNATLDNEEQRTYLTIRRIDE